MTKREELAEYLETQAYWCKVIADKLRNEEDTSDAAWCIDIFSTDEWKAEIAAIEGQERLQYEHEQIIELEAKTA